jgi:protein-S-isoprenylcysteine O-methyltransferase Ste14
MDVRYADLEIYAVHFAFWGAFVVTRMLVRSSDHRATGVAGSAPVARVKMTARHSRALMAPQGVAFAVLYTGVALVVFRHVSVWFAGQRLLGSIAIAVGALLMIWALLYFRSWRFRAELAAGHELATGGPFGFLRHPIYMGFNLLALGTALWMPATVVWIGFILMLIGSDLRARAEERILRDAFGSVYFDYCARIRRFIPGVY